MQVAPPFHSAVGITGTRADARTPAKKKQAVAAPVVSAVDRRVCANTGKKNTAQAFMLEAHRALDHENEQQMWPHHMVLPIKPSRRAARSRRTWQLSTSPTQISARARHGIGGGMERDSHWQRWERGEGGEAERRGKNCWD